MKKSILLNAFCGTSAELLVKDIKDYETLLLPNNKVQDSKMLLERILLSEYDYILAFGQRPNIKDKVHIETMARDGEACLKTDFDCELLQQLFFQNGIPAKLSYNAGTSFCNRLYWSGLQYLMENQKDKKTKMVFIHIPFKKNISNFGVFKERVFETVRLFVEK